MFITELSIKRPTVSWVMSLILIIFGLFVFWKLPVRELPNGIQPPVVQVQVDYKSASASIVDQEVTQVVEDVIGGAEGIKNIDSKSENGRSTINVEFDTSINLDNAANDIRERVARVVDNLPAESDPPQILKRAAGFTTTMWLSLSSSTWSDLELGDYAERYLVDQFSSVKNVGRIRVGGLRELSIRVWIDPIKLAANDLTIKEVETAMRGENISLPAGTLEADNIDLTLNLDKSYNDINAIKQLPIKKLDNRVILLSDVANIEFGPVSEKTLFKAQTKDQINLKTVGIGIYARSGASTVELSNDIKKKLIEVKKSLPEELDLRVSFNRANYVEAAIEEVYKTLIIAFVLVVLIIYLFLGNLKAVIVPAIALPVSLIASFLGLYIFGLSINIFVLLSFILAIGIITDDSVIMTDAIYRRIENGETPLVAAFKGSRQISFAIRGENVSLPAGTLEADNIDLTLNLDKSYNDIETIKQIPIKKTSNRVIQLSDVANVEFGPVSEKTLFKAQTKDQINLKTVGIGIYARSGASTVELSNDIKKKIVEVKKSLPEELDLRVSFNRANYVEAAIEEVYKTLVIAFILVVLIIYLFLGNLKAVIVPAIALPVSLIASFLGLYIFGLSINIFVLLSFILAIGIITDDSVIMTDAIYRRIENGETPLVAAYKGSKQISFAIVATTLILVAVFLPLIFIEGISGTLFRETAIALSFSIVVSSFVALTLSPMLASKFLYKKKSKKIFIQKFEKIFSNFAKFYEETLVNVINKTKSVSFFIVFIIIASVLLFSFSKKELLPMEDRGAYLIIGSTDEGSSFEYTQEQAQKVEARLIPLLQAEDSPYSRFIMRVPGFGNSANSYNSFIIIALLDDWKNRKKGQQVVLREAIGKIVTLPQALAFPISPQSIRVSNYNKPVQMVIYGNTYEELEAIQKKVI